LSLLWWTGCYVWAAYKMPDSLYRAFVVAALAVMLSSYVVYILFPTYVDRPALHGSNWQVELVRTIYSSDRLNNAFPSGHTYNSMLILFFWWDWQPKLRWLWVTIAVIIILSTLFTGQHNLLDPVGGIIWAWLGYRFGMWWTTRRDERA
jgi:membrane-associated phospholipid phosphatase